MSGLGDAHTHLSWNGGDLDRLGELSIEEHVLLTARSARCYLDSGYTMLVLVCLLWLLYCDGLKNGTLTFIGASVLLRQRTGWMLSFAMPSTPAIFPVQGILPTPRRLLVVMGTSWLASQLTPMDQRK